MIRLSKRIYDVYGKREVVEVREYSDDELLMMVYQKAKKDITTFFGYYNKRKYLYFATCYIELNERRFCTIFYKEGLGPVVFQ